MDFKNLQFRQWKVDLSFAFYVTGESMAIQLRDSQDGSPIATATVNLSTYLPANQVYVKDYSENEGMLQFLTDNKVVTLLAWEQHGFVEIAHCQLTKEAETVASKQLIKKGLKHG